MPNALLTWYILRKRALPAGTRLLVLVTFLLHNTAIYSQTATIDSLRQQLIVHATDTVGIKVCIQLGTELSRSDMKKAREYLYQGIALASKLNTSYGLTGCYSQLTTSFQNTSDTDSAEKYFSLLRAVADRRQGEDDKINYYMTAGLYYKNRSQFAESIKYMLRALELIDKQKYPSGYAGQLLNIGNTYANLGDVQKAASYHLRALTMFEELDNDRGRSFCYQSLGNSYLKLKQYDQSIKYLLRSRDLKEKLKDARGLIGTWSGLGNVYLETGDYERALASYSKALTQAQSLKLRREELRTLVDMGVLYARMNRTKEARAAFSSALPAAIESADSLVVARIRTELSKLDGEHVNAEKAIRSFEARIQAAGRAGDMQTKANAYKDLSEYYARDNNFEKAYHYLQLHHALNDSVSGKEIVLRFQELEQRYEKDKREREIDVLKKDQLLSLEKIARQKARQEITVLALLGVLVFLILLFLYLRLRSRVKRKEELYEVRNSIARDLHDDIGSALSSINIISQVALRERGDVRHHLQKISESASRMMEGMSDMVWSINPDNGSMEKMIIRMKEFAAEILEPADISYSIVVLGHVEHLLLDPKVRKSIFLVFKESINNTAKYSEGTHVTIEVSAQKSRLVLRVKDNGKGFSADIPSSGNGLHNMMSRAREVRGQVKLITAPGSGTEVLMELPLT